MSTLDEIGKLPIFKLSLGSKELFHSNFLEFLWEYEPDHAYFVGMINELLKKDNRIISLFPSSELGREKEHFDLCLFHEEGKKGRIVYDLILENKVKSLPDKGQLDRYVKDIEKKKKGNDPNPVFLLLSLAEDFPSWKEIKDDKNKKWTVVNYKNLQDAIAKQKWPQTTGFNYIGDYCTFIEKLHLLGKDILKNLKNEYIFQDVEAYKEERMHDLYIKLRCVLFLNLLKGELEKDPRIKGIIPVVFTEHDMIRKGTKSGLFLNVNIFRGTGQAAVFLYNGSGKEPDKGDIYEIVIQGDQYRHGINQVEDKEPEVRWKDLTQGGLSKEFLTSILGEAPSDGRGVCNHYGKNYVYKYRKMKTGVPQKTANIQATRRKTSVNLLDLTVKPLLEKMSKDIIDTAEKLGII